jgi:hypothetical protein
MVHTVRLEVLLRVGSFRLEFDPEDSPFVKKRFVKGPLAKTFADQLPTLLREH